MQSTFCVARGTARQLTPNQSLSKGNSLIVNGIFITH